MLVTRLSHWGRIGQCIKSSHRLKRNCRSSGFLQIFSSPVLAQQSAIGAGIGAKALTAFGWTRDGGRDVVIRLAFAEKTPWTSGDDRILDGAVLLGRRREPSEWGWVRGALGPAWVIHSPGGQREGGSTLGLAGQLDAVVNLGSVSRSRSWALGVTALANVNSRASFVAVGAALHMVR